ncbi:hypothetical protein, partial [Streptomyces sp. NPDC056540]
HLLRAASAVPPPLRSTAAGIPDSPGTALPLLLNAPGLIMQFSLQTDTPVLAFFEPTGQQYELDPGDPVLVKFFGGEDGEIRWFKGAIIIIAPTYGYTRAWDSDGDEIDIGPESGGETD